MVYPCMLCVALLMCLFGFFLNPKLIPSLKLEERKL